MKGKWGAACIGLLVVLTAFVTALTATAEDVTGLDVRYFQFGTSEYDEAYDIYVDETKKVVVGTTCGDMPGYEVQGYIDAFICLYDQDNTLQWVDQFGTDTTATYFEVASGVDVHPTGIYTVGAVHGGIGGEVALGGEDAFLRCYDFEGNVEWTKLIGTDSDDQAWDVMVDDTGVYVAGFTYGAFPDEENQGGADFFLAMYKYDGDLVWVNQIGTTYDEWGWTQISLDSSSICLSGEFTGNMDYPEKPNPNDPNPIMRAHSNTFVGMYDKTDGAEIWTTELKLYPATSTSAPNLAGLAGDRDASGIYIVGYLNGCSFPGYTTGDESDAFIVKLDYDGALVWAHQTTDTSRTQACGVDVTSTGVIVCGDTNGGKNAYVTKYSFEGDEIWHLDFAATEEYCTWAMEAYTMGSDIYVAGGTYNAFPDQTSLGQVDAFLVTVSEIPCIEVAPMYVEYGDIEKYYSCTEIITISNLGLSDLDVDGIFIVDGSSSYFTIESAPTTPTIIEPGSTIEVMVTFEPWEVGTFSGSLMISSDDPYYGQMMISLVGTGVDTAITPSEKMDKAKDYLEAAITKGDIVGNGDGSSASKHLDVFTDQLDVIAAMIKKDKVEAAIEKIDTVHQRTDGSSTPPDFIKGDGTKELAAILQETKESLESP